MTANLPSTSTPATDEDLYCLHCGYNLRGLAGEARRCPECGQMSSVVEMRVPADVIRRYVRKLEALPAMCVLASLLIVMVALPAVGTGAWGFAAVITFLSMGLWAVCAKAFANRCEGQPGWFVLIAQFHLVTVLYYGAFVVFFMGASRFSPVVLTGCVSVTMLVVGTLVYRAARRRLGTLQRRMAVTLASRELRFRAERGRLEEAYGQRK